MHTQITRVFFAFIALFPALLVTACAPMEAQHGNMLQDYQMQEIKAGVHTRSDVLQLLGSPTTVSTFNPDVWYYIGQNTEKRGILDDQVTEERIVEVKFDPEGVVTSIADVDTNRVDVPYARDKTPTHGNDLTFTQQLLGNMGRFNAQDKKK
ncbi:MAG: outer membrane protein assembly factor BamE [Alphaproteobacteria bacterium]|nr:outer membrane protein assembly factor BamE [Alphaproteobacteria bacterium]